MTDFTIINTGYGSLQVSCIFAGYELKLPFMYGAEKEAFAAMLRKAAYEIDKVECVTKASAIEAIDYCHENPGVDMRDVALETLEDVQ